MPSGGKSDQNVPSPLVLKQLLQAAENPGVPLLGEWPFRVKAVEEAAPSKEDAWEVAMLRTSLSTAQALRPGYTYYNDLRLQYAAHQSTRCAAPTKPIAMDKTEASAHAVPFAHLVAHMVSRLLRSLPLVQEQRPSHQVPP